MSYVIPASIQAGPHTTNSLISKRYFIIYLFLVWLSILPDLVLGAIYLELISHNIPILIISLPFALSLGVLILIITSFFWSWLLLLMINWKYPPREGIFPRDKKSKDYRYWSLRAVVKKFALWISHKTPLPWMDNLAFRLFGNKISLKTALFDAWVDAEFVRIGKNTIIGQGSVVMSSMLTTEYLIIKQVKIGDNCLIGAHSIVLPGTNIGDGVVLGALSSTNVDQELETGWVYWGTPAEKFKESKVRDEDGLTALERAQMKETEEVLSVMDDEKELPVRKGMGVAYQTYRSKRKSKRALRHEEKAQRQLEIAKRQKIIAEEAHIRAKEKFKEKVIKKESKISEKSAKKAKKLDKS